MTQRQDKRDFGLGRGKVFPASRARSLTSPLRRLVQSPQKTVAAMRLLPNARVLEIGCGPGYFSPSIAQATPQGIFVALDLQDEMLRRARNRLNNDAAVDFVRADTTRLPLRTAALDAVLIATVLGEVSDPDACLDEVRRVLVGDGIVSIAETRRDSDFVKLEKLTRLVEGHRFQFVAKKGPSWQYIARYRAI